MDEGWLLSAVEKISHGGMPYVTSYQFYSPGRFYVFALLFSIFGENILVVRLFWVLCHALLTLLIYRLSLYAVKGFYAFLPPLAVWLVPGPWHKTPFMLGTVTAFWLILRYVRFPRPINTFWMGFGIAFVLFFRQDVGLFYFVPAAAVSLFSKVSDDRKLKKRNFLIFMLAFLLPTFIWLSYFVVNGGGKEMFHQLVFAGAKGFATNPLPYPRLFDIQAQGFWDKLLAIFGNGAFYLPILVLGVFLRFWILERNELDILQRRFWDITAVSTLLGFNQLRARPDFAHLWQVYPLVDIMTALILWRISFKRPRTAQAMLVLFLLIIGGAGFSDNSLHHGGIRVLERRTSRLENPRAHVRLTPEEKSLYTDVENIIRKYTSKNEHIFLLPDIPLFYFLTGRKNPTRWDVLRPSFIWNREEEKEAIELLEASKVKLVVIREEDDIPPAERRFAESYPLIYDYIQGKFEQIERRDDFRFFVLKKSE